MGTRYVNLVCDFFKRNTKPKAEIIEGLLCEGQLAAFAGPFGVGKSPLLADLTVCLVRGINWCGRRVEQRPVILVDCETAGPDYKRAVQSIAARYQVTKPRVPDELRAFLEHDDQQQWATAALLGALEIRGHLSKLNLLRDALTEKPNAVVFVDPLELFFLLDTVKKIEVMVLYIKLRKLLADFPHSALVSCNSGS
jgi:RecA-family ATPase